MIRKVYMNGQVNTFLVFEDHHIEPGFNPIIETLKEQAERIENLESQNRELIKQEEILIHLVEITVQTGELIVRSLQSLEKIEDNLLDNNLPEES